MKTIKYTGCLLAIMTLISCSNLSKNLPSYDSLLQAETGQDGKACINKRIINRFGYLDDNVLTVDTRPKGKFYIATTTLRCRILHSPDSIGIKGAYTEFCGSNNDKIITENGTCNVKALYEFDSQFAAYAAFDKVLQTREELRVKADSETVKGKDFNSEVK